MTWSQLITGRLLLLDVEWVSAMFRIVGPAPGVNYYPPKHPKKFPVEEKKMQLHPAKNWSQMSQLLTLIPCGSMWYCRPYGGRITSGALRIDGRRSVRNVPELVPSNLWGKNAGNPAETMITIVDFPHLLYILARCSHVLILIMFTDSSQVHPLNDYPQLFFATSEAMFFACGMAMNLWWGGWHKSRVKQEAHDIR